MELLLDLRSLQPLSLGHLSFSIQVDWNCTHVEVLRSFSVQEKTFDFFSCVPDRDKDQLQM
jgi:hypothetical protein